VRNADGDASPDDSLLDFCSGARPRALPVLSLARPAGRSLAAKARSSSPAKARSEAQHRQVPKCARSGMPPHLEQWKREAARRTRRRREEEAARLDEHGFGGDVDGFRAFLAHGFGNSARGWRVAVAPDELGAQRVPFSVFCASLRRMGYAGNANSLWRALRGTAKGSSVGLENLEPDLADMLDAVARELAQQSPGGAAATFAEARGGDPAAKAAAMSFPEFVDLLRRRIEGDEETLDIHGEVHRSAARLFAALALTERGVLSCREFCFLDHWAHHRLGSPLPEAAALGHVRKVPDPFAAPDPGASLRAPARRREPGLAEFREHLASEFGTPARAWRMRLDLKGSGVVSASELKEACRAVDWRHPHMPLWRELCAAGGGQATVCALDPETAAAVDTLREEARDRFGSLGMLWHEALDPEGTGVVSQTEFVRIVGSELGIGASAARRVFSTLDVAGAGWLAAVEFGYLDFFGRGPGIRPASEPSGDTVRSGRPPIWSPARSTRCVQHRAVSFTKSVKHKWLASAVMDRCKAVSEPSLEEQQHSLQAVLSTMPHGHVFRTTNEFYRQGVSSLRPQAAWAAQTG